MKRKISHKDRVLAAKNRKVTKEDKEWVMRKGEERNSTMAQEIRWAFGANMPMQFRVPPEWLKICILIWFFGKPSAPDPKELSLEAIIPQLLGNLDGLAKTALAAVDYPTASEQRAEEKIPEIKRLRECAKTWLTKSLRREGAASVDLLRPLVRMQADQEAYFNSARDGSQLLSELDEEPSNTKEILWYMWFCWEEAEAAWSRENFHEWMCGMQFVNCEWNIFEKVCRQVGYRSKRIRPRRK